MIQDYIYQIGLPKLEKKGEHWNFRCVICGDSKKNEFKKSGWILNKSGTLFYYCHNCDASFSFKFFLKKYYPHIYSDYIKEKFMKKKVITKFDEIISKKNEIIFPIKNLIKIIDLPPNHAGRKYIENRKIPFKHHNILYYCENYQKEINKLFPDKFKKYPISDERIVIPYYNKKKIPFIQGRTITNDYLRYITINLLSNFPKIYGIERINIGKLIKIVEGPIDSLFLDNCLAMGSSSVNHDDLLSISSKSNFVFIYDLETRNQAIIKKIHKIVDKGFKVCLMPHEFRKFGKDINEFIKNGLTKEEIQLMIKKNTFSGLIAKIKLKFWKHC